MQAIDFPLVSHSPKRWAEFLKGRKPIPESIILLNSQGRRSWAAMDNYDLLAYAKFSIGEMGIRSRGEFGDKDSGLCATIRKRGLMGAVGLENMNAGDRRWAQKNDDEIVGFSLRLIEERKVSARVELASCDRGLYNVLSKRGLLARVPFARIRESRDWTTFSDDEMVSYAKEKIENEGIRRRYGLHNLDKGFYDALRRRDLLGAIGLRSTKEGNMDWRKFNNAELLSLTRDFIIENDVRSKTGLKKAEGGLAVYKILRRRGLLNELRFPQERNQWRRMGNEQLVEYAQRFLSEEGIRRKGELRGVNSALYAALLNRGLIGEAFSEVESSRQKEAVNGVIDALKSFGDDK